MTDDMDTIHIFIASDQRMEKAELALEYSIRKHGSGPIEIHWMRAGDPGWTVGDEKDSADWNIGRKPGAPYSGRGWATEFTSFRWAIPHLCGFQGKAIYFDVDQLLVADVRKLWDQPQDKPVLALAHSRDWFWSDVMLLDCSAFEREWWPEISDIKRCGRRGDRYQKLIVKHRYWKPLPQEWDCRDIVPKNACLVHFTNMRTQPWKPWPEVFKYPDQHPNKDCESLWQSTYTAARSEWKEWERSPSITTPLKETSTSGAASAEG